MCKSTLLLCFWLVATSFAVADSYTATVVGISDGDTITVLDDVKVQHKIRFAHIDCPESGQAFGSKAKQVLSEKIFGKLVSVTVTNVDHYKREISELRLDGRHINLEMVAEGFAWHYKQYSKSKEFADAEVAAREGKVGLWVDKAPIPPWEFRKGPPQNPKEAVARVTEPPKGSSPNIVPPAKTGVQGTYWINDSSNSRHNARCKYFNNTKRGHFSELEEGKACGICGG
jgi:endonuclease YncB( thermonuclease family)